MLALSKEQTLRMKLCKMCCTTLAMK